MRRDVVEYIATAVCVYVCELLQKERLTAHTHILSRGGIREYSMQEPVSQSKSPLQPPSRERERTSRKSQAHKCIYKDIQHCSSDDELLRIRRRGKEWALIDARVELVALIYTGADAGAIYICMYV